MRRVIWLVITAALLFLPYGRGYAEEFPYEKTMDLILAERYQEALDTLRPFLSDTSGNNRLEAQALECTAYSLWGKKSEASDACNKALAIQPIAEHDRCAESDDKNPTSYDWSCGWQGFKSEFVGAKAWQALSLLRRGELRNGEITLKGRVPAPCG